MRTELPDQDSNLDKQNQNLLCYRYTIGYRERGGSLVEQAGVTQEVERDIAELLGQTNRHTNWVMPGIAILGSSTCVFQPSGNAVGTIASWELSIISQVICLPV